MDRDRGDSLCGFSPAPAGGVFTIDEPEGQAGSLESHRIIELVTIGERIFAGTANGLHVSDDRGATWSFAGLGGNEVWQVRGASDGYAVCRYRAGGPSQEHRQW